MSTMGQRIKAFRLKKGLTHQQMADRLQMTRQGFTKIEGDLVNIPRARIEEIAAILDVAPGALFPRRPRKDDLPVSIESLLTDAEPDHEEEPVPQEIAP